MCFSATASFTAGIPLLIVGVMAIQRVRNRKELLYALIPMLFAIQQLIEGALWLTFPAKAPLLNMVLTYAYSIFSHVIWPMYIPVAVLLLESTAWRRKVLFAIALVGTFIGLYLLYYLVRFPIVAEVKGHHIVYISPHFHALHAMGLYLLGTCISSLFSSHRMVKLFGAAAFLSFMIAYAIYATWFISVWCFFAAILSWIVLLYFPSTQVQNKNMCMFNKLIK